MQHGIEDDLRALWDDMPAPTPQFLLALRRSVEMPAPRVPARRRGRAWRRFLVFAVAFAAIAAAAYAATESPFYSSANRRSIVSNSFTVTDPTPTSLGDVAAALSCQPAGSDLACSSADPAAPDATYRLRGRAGADVLSSGPVNALPLDSEPATRVWTLFTFATDGSSIVIHDGSPPIIACPTPAANGQLVCEPLLASQTYPAGTPMYEDDVTK